eukprot:TRINITY_DN2817_c0_g2_i1.p1 TRINITY_DN2817_c0_g2~~TRINITY_DN2817_c0_g2_i1.p1  ORF type:complete len:877 (-),score=360.65 TRINITY_DN2817_c0_g2_i1:106-2736(-)
MSTHLIISEDKLSRKLTKHITFDTFTTLELPKNKLEFIEDCSSCIKLKKVNLQGNNLKTKESIEGLFSAQSIEELDLQDNQITQMDKYRYYILANLPNLNILDNKKVTPLEKRHALNLFPNNKSTQSKIQTNNQQSNNNNTTTSKKPFEEEDPFKNEDNFDDFFNSDPNVQPKYPVKEETPKKQFIIEVKDEEIRISNNNNNTKSTNEEVKPKTKLEYEVTYEVEEQKKEGKKNEEKEELPDFFNDKGNKETGVFSNDIFSTSNTTGESNKKKVTKKVRTKNNENMDFDSLFGVSDQKMRDEKEKQEKIEMLKSSSISSNPEMIFDSPNDSLLLLTSDPSYDTFLSETPQQEMPIRIDSGDDQLEENQNNGEVENSQQEKSSSELPSSHYDNSLFIENKTDSSSTTENGEEIKIDEIYHYLLYCWKAKFPSNWEKLEHSKVLIEVKDDSSIPIAVFKQTRQEIEIVPFNPTGDDPVNDPSFVATIRGSKSFIYQLLQQKLHTNKKNNELSFTDNTLEPLPLYHELLQPPHTNEIHEKFLGEDLSTFLSCFDISNHTKHLFLLQRQLSDDNEPVTSELSQDDIFDTTEVVDSPTATHSPNTNGSSLSSSPPPSRDSHSVVTTGLPTNNKRANSRLEFDRQLKKVCDYIPTRFSPLDYDIDLLGLGNLACFQLKLGPQDNIYRSISVQRGNEPSSPATVRVEKIDKLPSVKESNVLFIVTINIEDFVMMVKGSISPIKTPLQWEDSVKFEGDHEKLISFFSSFMFDPQSFEVFSKKNQFSLKVLMQKLAEMLDTILNRFEKLFGGGKKKTNSPPIFKNPFSSSPNTTKPSAPTKNTTNPNKKTPAKSSNLTQIKGKANSENLTLFQKNVNDFDYFFDN